MSIRRLLLVFILLLLRGNAGAQNVESGIEAGMNLPGPFHLEEALRKQSIQSGPKAGTNIPDAMLPVVVVHAEWPDFARKRHSFVEQYGARPYVLIFARTASEPLTGLVTKVDAEIAKHRDAKGKKDTGAGAVCGVVILLSDQDGLDEQLRKLAKQLEINHLSFAIDRVGGPPAYRLAKEADLTVLLVNRRKVEANYAFRKGELRDMNVSQILGDLEKIVKADRH